MVNSTQSSKPKARTIPLPKIEDQKLSGISIPCGDCSYAKSIQVKAQKFIVDCWAKGICEFGIDEDSPECAAEVRKICPNFIVLE